MRYLLLLVIFSVSMAAGAADDPRKIPEGFEPEVRIIDTGTGLVEEFRSSGRVYMIKVTPKKGRPYYLVDADGDGNMETHRSETAPRMLIPSWVLFSW
ncbi:MAG: DUF2782 domain-containing protein [Gammaproteobacteria bacterium]|nr:DUF2782 domain-containing protein [Gammaproteobacteria bacterium]